MMRLLVVSMILLFTGQSSWAAIVHVVSTGAQGSGPVTSVTTPAIDTTGANLIVVTYTRDSTAAAAVTPISDSNGNTWVASTAEQVSGGLGQHFTRQFHVASPTVGAGHTFTFTLAAGGFPSIGVSAFSGAVSAAPLDATASGTDGTTPFNSPLTAVLAQADEVAVGSLALADLNQTIAVTSGYTSGFVADSTATTEGIGHEWKILASTAAVQSAFTATVDHDAANQVGTYKASLAAARERMKMGVGQ